ncbi:hypothetical protein [Streptomyces sp. NPDC047061]
MAAVRMAIGVVAFLVLIRRHPERMAETARVRLDEDTTGTVAAQNGATPQ